jgi:hypothetical protein
VRVVVAPAEDFPFEVNAMVFEDDTYFVLGADTEVREPKEHPVRVWTEVHETEPAALGSVRVREGRPLRLHVHDLSDDPTVRLDSVSTALTEILRLVDDRGIRALGLPVLGTVHGKLPAETFARSLRDALRAGRRLHWSASGCRATPNVPKHSNVSSRTRPRVETAMIERIQHEEIEGIRVGG